MNSSYWKVSRNSQNQPDSLLRIARLHEGVLAYPLTSTKKTNIMSRDGNGVC